MKRKVQKNRMEFQEGFCSGKVAALRSLAGEPWDSFLLIKLELLWHISERVFFLSCSYAIMRRRRKMNGWVRCSMVHGRSSS